MPIIDSEKVSAALGRLRDDDRTSREDAIEILRVALSLDEDFEPAASHRGADKLYGDLIDTGPWGNDDEVTLTPWTNGYHVGYLVECNGQRTHMYFNPSTSGDSPDLFIYAGPAGDPEEDDPVCFISFKASNPLPGDEDRCEHGGFFSGAGACPQCGGGATFSEGQFYTFETGKLRPGQDPGDVLIEEAHFASDEDAIEHAEEIGAGYVWTADEGQNPRTVYREPRHPVEE